MMLTHIRAVISGRYGRHEDVVIALDQVAQVEAVIQAARDVADKSPALMSDTPFAHALNNLHKHLAALEDGQ